MSFNTRTGNITSLVTFLRWSIILTVFQIPALQITGSEKTGMVLLQSRMAEQDSNCLFPGSTTAQPVLCLCRELRPEGGVLALASLGEQTL